MMLSTKDLSIIMQVVYKEHAENYRVKGESLNFENIEEDTLSLFRAMSSVQKKLEKENKSNAPF